MSEETQTKVPDPIKFETDEKMQTTLTKESVDTKEEIKYTEEETKAIKKGWVPLDQFKGDPSEFKGAKAFLKDGDLFDHISNSNKQIKELKETLNVVMGQLTKTEKQTHEKTVDELKRKQLEAAELGNKDEVAKLTEEIVKSSVPVIAQPVTNPIAEAKKEFLERNPWYDVTSVENADLIEHANKIDLMIRANRPDLSPSEHLKLVEQHVKNKFSDRFNTQKVMPKNVSVESSTNVVDSRTKKASFNDLPDFHKNIVRNLQKSIKNFDVGTYINQLKQIGEI